MSKVVHTSDGTSVIAHMHWSPYLPSKKDRSVIRNTSKMVSGLRYVIDEAGDDKQIAFESADPFAVSGKSSRRRACFAMLCREYLFDPATSGENANQNGIFVMPMSDDADKRAICVIRNGRIVQDTVEQRARAFDVAKERHREMAGYCLVIAELDELPIDRTHVATWEDLMAYVAKQNLLSAVPSSPMVPLALLALVAAIGGGTAYYYMVYQPEVEAERARKQAATDKTPQYIKALRAAAQDAGWERKSLASAIEAMKARPYFLAGWSLSKVECNPKRCMETWDRQGGDLDQLIKANADATMVADDKLNKDLAVMERPVTSVPGVVDLEALPAGGLDMQVVFKPVVQVLDNAGVRLLFGKEESWPKMPLNGVKKAALVKAQKLELVSKYPLASEALDKVPSTVVFSGFSLNTSNPKDFLITVEGNAYVR